MSRIGFSISLPQLADARPIFAYYSCSCAFRDGRKVQQQKKMSSVIPGFELPNSRQLRRRSHRSNHRGTATTTPHDYRICKCFFARQIVFFFFVSPKRCLVWVFDEDFAIKRHYRLERRPNDGFLGLSRCHRLWCLQIMYACSASLLQAPQTHQHVRTATWTSCPPPLLTSGAKTKIHFEPGGKPLNLEQAATNSNGTRNSSWEK